MNYIDKEVIGKTIANISEGYEPQDGVRVWTNRILFTDGTSAIVTLERNDFDGDAHSAMRMDKATPLTGGYEGPLPRPACDCQSWGCWGCCNTESEIRAKQGIYG